MSRTSSLGIDRFEEASLSAKRLIVGLGNPGGEYAGTRHNLGFMVVSEIARRKNLGLAPKEWSFGEIAEGAESGYEYILLRPVTFMNRSGIAVQKVMAKKGLEIRDVLVVCDDLNLEFGQIRFRASGSPGGHNGLKSIAAAINSDDYPRLRMGIGRPPAGQDPAEYVLKNFLPVEKKELAEFVGRAADGCLAWLSQDLDQVMSQFNKRTENG